MSLLFMDGFDHYGTGAGSGTPLLTKWGSTNASPTATAASARTGSAGLFLSSTVSNIISKPFPASGGFVLGVAMRNVVGWSAADLIQLREGSTAHLVVAVAAGPVLTVKRGTTVLQTGATVLAVNTWYYLEFKGVIDDSAGSYELRLDGVTELAASGVDTRNAGTTGQWDRLFLQGSNTNGMNYDDLYLCDQSGAIRNDFLGTCKVETLYPQTDAVAAGSNAGLTPSTGTDHGALVDEASPNTTDYNSSPTVGLKDTYQYPPLALTGTILGIQTNLYASKSDAAARQVCAVVRAGGTDYDGANVAPGTTFGYFSEVRAQNPNTGADWTSGEIDTLEAGMKVTV